MKNMKSFGDFAGQTKAVTIPEGTSPAAPVNESKDWDALDEAWNMINLLHWMVDEGYIDQGKFSTLDAAFEDVSDIDLDELNKDIEEEFGANKRFMSADELGMFYDDVKEALQVLIKK